MASRLLILILFQFGFIPLFAQNDWIRQAGNKLGPDNGFHVENDSLDNCYVTGNFTGNASFGDTLVSSVENDDCYVAKYDSNGKLVWIKTFGGKGAQCGNSMAVQRNGDIILAGNFTEELIINDTHIKSGNHDIFIIKLNSLGKILWYKTFGNFEFNDIQEIKLDKENNLLAVGRISGTIPIENSLLVSHDKIDGYLIKLNREGNLIWCHAIGGIEDDETGNISIDKQNNIFINGKGGYKIFLDNDSIKTTEPYTSFIAKFSTDGQLLVFKTYGEEFLTETGDIENDNYGNLYITGYHCGPIKIDNTTFPSAPESRDAMFIAKFDNEMKLQWFNHYFSSGNSYGASLNFDNENFCYLTGTFYNDIELNKKKIVTKDRGGSVVLKFNPNGILETYKTFIGTGDVNFWNSCISMPSNYIFTTGSFTKCFKFENQFEICSENNKDILIMKLNKDFQNIQK